MIAEPSSNLSMADFSLQAAERLQKGFALSQEDLLYLSLKLELTSQAQSFATSLRRVQVLFDKLNTLGVRMLKELKDIEEEYHMRQEVFMQEEKRTFLRLRSQLNRIVRALEAEHGKCDSYQLNLLEDCYYRKYEQNHERHEQLLTQLAEARDADIWLLHDNCCEEGLKILRELIELKLPPREVDPIVRSLSELIKRDFSSKSDYFHLQAACAA